MKISIEAIVDALKNHLDKNAILQITNESEQHRGHKGYNIEVGITHIALSLTWNGFEELTLIERQRLVNSWLDSFFKQGLHSVQYCLKTPSEK